MNVNKNDFNRFYAKLCRLLTDYENDEYTDESDLYNFLVDLQNKMDFLEREE